MAAGAEEVQLEARAVVLDLWVGEYGEGEVESDFQWLPEPVYQRADACASGRWGSDGMNR